jgi:hypothetical protein
VGLEEHDPKILAFAKHIHESRMLKFGGILSHGGQAYGCHTLEECTQVAEHERQTMIRIKNRLEEVGNFWPSSFHTKF